MKHSGTVSAKHAQHSGFTLPILSRTKYRSFALLCGVIHVIVNPHLKFTICSKMKN